jgi:hypothetical protein
MPNLFSRRRTGAPLLLAALFLAACDQTDLPTVSGAPPLNELSLTVKVSSLNATSGDLIAVAIDPEYAGTLSGVQGFLRFDESRLAYIGQRTDRGVMLVNARRAERGELRFAAVREGGFVSDIGDFVFEVRRSDYSRALQLVVTEASTASDRFTRLISKVSVRRWIDEDAALLTDDATPMSAADWMRRLEPAADPRAGEVTLARPGEYKSNLKFGDANLTGGAPTIGDVVFLLNVAVGLNELLIDSDTSSANRRDAVIAGNVSPDNTPGLGEPNDALRPGVTSATDFGSITLSDAVAVLGEIGNPAQVVVGETIPGRPTTLPSNRVIVSGNVAGGNWTKNNIYELQGGVTVSGGTLTIEPGTRVEGQRGTGPGVGGAALSVQRDGRLVADGTPLEPIVFTCVGVPKVKGCWGGLVINGNATLNDGTATSPIIPGRAATGMCNEKQGEGSSGLYGGCNPADDSGILRYVVIEYSGFRFTTTNELNGLALQGVGTGTVIDFVQVHAGQDDGFELFGGTVNVKHLLITASSDDGFDYTEGWSGKGQFIIVQADSLDGDKGFENDGHPAGTAIATPTIWNATVIGKLNPSSSSGADPNNNVEGGLHTRVGARVTYGNFIVMNFPFALDIDNDITCAPAPPPYSFTASVFFNNNTLDNTDTGDPVGCVGTGGTEATYLQGAGNQFGNPNLLAAFNVVTPDFRPAFGSGTGCATPPADAFFDAAATYCGAVPPANASKSNIPWYAGWSRGWQTLATP